MKNMKKNKTLRTALIVVAVLMVGLTIAYAATLLSSNLNISVNKVTQNAMEWNVGFNPGNVTGTASGSSDSTGRSCGTATVTATTVTVADTTLSKPNDKCTYALTVKNTGGIDATLKTITAVKPTSTQCTISGASMTCGNLVYKLTTDSSGSTLLTSGGTLVKTNGTQPVYLVISYEGSDVNSSAVNQTLGGFTLLYEQK